MIYLTDCIQTLTLLDDCYGSVASLCSNHPNCVFTCKKVTKRQVGAQSLIPLPDTKHHRRTTKVSPSRSTSSIRKVAQTQISLFPFHLSISNLEVAHVSCIITITPTHKPLEHSTNKFIFSSLFTTDYLSAMETLCLCNSPKHPSNNLATTSSVIELAQTNTPHAQAEQTGKAFPSFNSASISSLAF